MSQSPKTPNPPLSPRKSRPASVTTENDLRENETVIPPAGTRPQSTVSETYVVNGHVYDRIKQTQIPPRKVPPRNIPRRPGTVTKPTTNT